MARESRTSRDEALREIERAANRLAIPARRDGARLVLDAGGRELRVGGGGGAGTIRAEAIVDGEIDAVVVLTPLALIERLRRLAVRGG
jgi:hypothetical protein